MSLAASSSTFLPRRAAYVFNGQLQQPTTVRQLSRTVEPVPVSASCQFALDRFFVDAGLYALPVVDEQMGPVALLDRKSYVEFFGRPYIRELFGRRSIVDLLAYEPYGSASPLVVDEGSTVEDAARMIIDAGMQHMVTGFVVSRQGRYVGVANGHDLLNTITQRKQAELYYLAHYDALTGIPNRALLADRLEHACLEADRKGSLVALLFIDVDRFKQINDSLGHSAGDEVLRRIVARLKASARQVDTVARLAGDEFVVLMENLSSPGQAELVADRIVASMQEPIEMLGHSLVATVSIGSAIYPRDDDQIHNILSKADAAMYEAKSAGRNGFCSYSPEMHTYNPASMSLESELRKAIERDELVLFFQPQVDLASGKVRGVEALVRWHHPRRGLIPPMQFIPVAEESGLIIQLGEWVVRQALAQLRAWQAQGMRPLPVAVNISALQLRQKGFVGFLRAQLAECAIEPGLLELELTESVLMKDVEEMLRTLNEIKALGVRLAIDDFGTGFSSLSYLRRFPIDRLKIDQSFVRDIDSTPVNASIARAIVALANSLSLEIVAEGIEKPAEVAVLQQMHCHEGQGYLFSRPIEAACFPGWLETHSALELAAA
jgi:diguanylate cyclase (GGDEF)-like protein